MRRDLENLTSYGFKHEYRDLQCIAMAAKLRIVETVASDAAMKHNELGRTHAENWYRPFGAWHISSLYTLLWRNKEDLRLKGVTSDQIKSVAYHTETSRNYRKDDNFQAAAYSAIKKCFKPYDPEDRLRRKIHQWKLHDPPAHVANRILRNMAIIREKCRPCVAAYLFRTVWNGWPTSARMNAATVEGCVLGCEHAEDRIEHYLLCSKVWDTLKNHPPRGADLDESQRSLTYMMLATKGSTEEAKISRAIAIYAIGRTVQAVRRSGKPVDISPTLRLFLA
jgi:hypothetical protein